VNIEEFAVAPLPALDGPLRFLLIARLIRDKGVVEFVESGRRLRKSYPGVELHVVGGLDDNPESISREELSAWIDEGLIEYHGRLQDVRPIIAHCHVFVLPSFYREGIPRTILEAMAMGRPVITCDAPGCRETVAEGENGYLVPTRDVPALAAAMRRFIEEPSRIMQMGQAARQLVERRYDVTKVNEQMLLHMGLEPLAPSRDVVGAGERRALGTPVRH
jgi:glycosyltransferase involved in cell wall biosynthesis